MKKIVSLLLVWILCISFCACRKEKEPDARPTQMEENMTETLQTEPEPKYGVLQELVDAYGFPIKLRMTEGMELTAISLRENDAERLWASSLVTGEEEYKNLTWTITGDHLVISGDWNEAFTIDIESGTAISLLSGKSYKIVVFDEQGNGKFYQADS